MQANSATQHRQQGNQEYKKAFGNSEIGLEYSPSSRVFYATVAIRCYQKAENIAKSTEDLQERFSASKSLGVVTSALARDAYFQETSSKESVLFQFRESLIHFSNCLALKNTISLANEEETGGNIWKAHIAEKVVDLISAIESYVINCEEIATSLQRVANYQYLLANSKQHHLVGCLLHQLIAKEFYKLIVIADNESKNWQQMLQTIPDFEQELVWTNFHIIHLRNSPEIYEHQLVAIQESFEELEQSLNTYRSRAEGLKFITLAQQTENILVNESEFWNAELLWDSIDLYRAAMVAASRTYNVPSYEHEAIAAARMGRLFDHVLKNYDKSRNLYFHAVQLADSITHTSGQRFFNCDWYQIAKDGILEDNKRREAYDQKQLNEKRGPALEKLKSVLDAFLDVLKQYQSRGYRAYYGMQHLYTNHPPKNGAQFPEEISKDDKEEVLKRALRKCIADFHVDRQFNKDAGVEWIVFCEEVTKELNGIYARYKG